jgi:hypothetical protein
MAGIEALSTVTGISPSMRFVALAIVLVVVDVDV